MFSFKAWVSAMKFFHEEKGYDLSAIKIFCRQNIIKSYRYANRPMECENLYEKFERKGLLQLTPAGDRLSDFRESKPQYSNYDDL